jgi:hemoglobin
MSDTLYTRLGGYDAIVAVVDDLLARLKADAQLGRFWQHRGEDGVLRERQLLINFLSSSAGGPLMYVGRDMKTTHKGMGISESDWLAFIGHVDATLASFEVPASERTAVIGFVGGIKGDPVTIEPQPI